MAIAERLRPPCAPPRSQATRVPIIHPGDHLTLHEFLRRWEAMPELKLAELIEGVVHMPSPVAVKHGAPHAAAICWAVTYAALSVGVQAADNVTVLLDSENVAQPDVRIRRMEGGTSRVTESGYIAGAPELVMEIAHTTASYDLHEKLRVYRRTGVQEYAVWRVDDGAIDWWELVDGVYTPLPVDADGVCASRVYTGLVLNVPAMLAEDMSAVLGTLHAVRHGAAEAQGVPAG